MDARTAKNQVAAADLELFYDYQWKSWGIIAPGKDVESEWFSPGTLRDMNRAELDNLIGLVTDRVAAADAF